MGVLDILGAGPIATAIDDIIKMFPNADQRNAVQLKLYDLTGQIAASQSMTNTAEASTGSIFLSGWRPLAAWACSLSFVYSLIQPLLHLPAIDATVQTNMLYGLLGLGTWKSAEKVGGVATTAIKGLFGK